MRSPMQARPAAQTSASQACQWFLRKEKIQRQTKSTVALAGRQCISYGYVPNRMNRYFSATKPQQAPLAARHALESGRQTASTKAQSMKAGMIFHSANTMARVMAPWIQVGKKLSFRNFIGCARCT